jgi:predicted transcriptional regulator
MLLSSIVEKLNLDQVTADTTDREITGGYASDLLSDVLANAKDGYIWVTNQKHQNCAAVASLLGISAIIIAGGMAPDENTVEKATAEHIPLFTTNMATFEVCGKLFALGIGQQAAK